jgi:polysaccharide deacetylase 2 family uncharacterized protein YibQ
MSHELEDNKERRRHILAKMRQYPNGLPYQKLVAMIMDEFGYNLRGAKEKVTELSYMGYIKEKNLYWFDAETLAQTHALKREEGRRKVTKASVQENSTRQEEI